MDKLEYMFQLQKELQKTTMGVELPDDRPDLINTHALGLFTEIGEVLQADKRWKPWRKDATCDKEEVKKELADCWAFLVNLTLVCDVDFNEMFDYFLDKHYEVLNRDDMVIHNEEDKEWEPVNDDEHYVEDTEIDTSFKDEVGGVHDEGLGWNPQGIFCGECSNSTCVGCPAEHKIAERKKPYVDDDAWEDDL